MTRGYFDNTGAPHLDCTITIPELGIEDQPLTMLVSTGTALSTMHPHDAHLIGVDPSYSLNKGYYSPTVKATLSFNDDKAGPIRFTMERFKIINPVNRYLKPASVLGMDVLRRWNMEYNPRDNSLTFDPAH